MPMATRAHKLDKSVHSAGQAVFCELMIGARKTAGLTQHELAKGKPLRIAVDTGGQP